MTQAKAVEAPAVSQRHERQEAQITELRKEADDTRREHARFGVDLDVSLGSDHNFYAGFAENLSGGGVFVATHALKPAGEIVELSITLPDSNAVITARGEVRWIREYNEASNVPPGMGIKFTQLGEGAEDAINAFLARREPMFFDDDL
jgi:uncharacterized protein (TIGR02266 family)